MENSWINEDSSEKNPSDLIMTGELISKYLTAFGDVIMDLDMSRSLKCNMFDKSILLNPTFSIESTFLTINNEKHRFFLICTEPLFSGVLLTNPVPGQLEWIEKKLKESISNLDNLLLDLYFSSNTLIGVLTSGCFIPFKIILVN
jgi:hypothetical protein